MNLGASRQLLGLALSRCCLSPEACRAGAGAWDVRPSDRSRHPQVAVATLIGMGTAPDRGRPPRVGVRDHHRIWPRSPSMPGVPACMNGISAPAAAARDKGRGRVIKEETPNGEKVRCAEGQEGSPSFMVLKAAQAPFWQRTAYPRLELGEHMTPSRDQAAPGR